MHTIGALAAVHAPPVKFYMSGHAVVCLVKFIRSFNLGDKMRMRDTQRIDRNAAVRAGLLSLRKKKKERREK